MTTTPPPYTRTSAVLTALLVPLECGLAGLGYSSWRSTRLPTIDVADVGSLVVLGASAAVGAVVYVLATIAIARRARGHRLAQVTVLLAYLRLLAVIVALSGSSVVLGLPSIAGQSLWLASALCVGDALAGVWLAAVAVRRTRHG